MHVLQAASNICPVTAAQLVPWRSDQAGVPHAGARAAVPGAAAQNGEAGAERPLPS
jgi:hypothetical protein